MCSSDLDADPDRLAQALRNLIDNAIAHTHAPAGRVSLTTTVLPAGRIRFTVDDNGPGIAADEHERVFNRFHRTDAARDRASGGAGLGLAIVQAIASAHGGTVRVAESDVGPVKAVEHAFALVGCNPRTVVVNREADPAGGQHSGRQRHPPGRRMGVRDRIVDQVAQRLGKPVGIGVEIGRAHV